jgi:hypothetical protein
MPRGGVGGGVLGVLACSPPGNFVGKNIKGGTKGKIGISLPAPPLENSSEKNLKVKFNPPSNFENFQS